MIEIIFVKRGAETSRQATRGLLAWAYGASVPQFTFLVRRARTPASAGVSDDSAIPEVHPA
jgi:hypothetical protein